MSSASDTAATPPAPRPSVFISYASEDRAAARLLRDALAASGLEVWYDENELGGGDAWDQKIRRQIRDCEYFMPVISAATDRRKEGYFRREWRLATERTLDMADDVLFLVPVAIDDTTETTARVPDKFLQVQWLRLPGGMPTPALATVVRRMLNGDHHALTRAPWGMARPATTTPTPAAPPVLGSGSQPNLAASTATPAEPDQAPPPMPPFPHPPEKGGFGHTVKFIAEAFWWALTAAWMLFRRLPKWGKVIVTIWLVITLFSTRCSPNRDTQINFGDSPKNQSHTALAEAEAKKAIHDVAEEFAQAARDARKSRNPADLARVGNEIARSFSPGGSSGPGGPEGAITGKRLVMVPFTKISSEAPAEKFASAVFASLYGSLTLTHAREVGLFRQSPANTGETGDTALVARAKQSGSSFILAGHLAAEGQPPALTVRVLTVADGTVEWTKTYPTEGSEPTDVAEEIASHLLTVLPKRPQPPSPPASPGTQPPG